MIDVVVPEDGLVTITPWEILYSDIAIWISDHLCWMFSLMSFVFLCEVVCVDGADDRGWDADPD